MRGWRIDVGLPRLGPKVVVSALMVEAFVALKTSSCPDHCILPVRKSFRSPRSSWFCLSRKTVLGATSGTVSDVCVSVGATSALGTHGAAQSAGYRVVRDTTQFAACGTPR